VRTATLLVYDSPAQTGAGPVFGVPAFDFILERGSAVLQPQRDPVSWLCARFGLKRERDWPVAPVLARAAGLRSGHAVWLCADPVHVELGSGPAAIIPTTALALDESESTELAGALDSHFAARGLRVFAFDRERWLINTGLPAGIDSQPLNSKPDDAAALLVRGADAAHWNAFLTEAQMLLHAHPVNIARHTAGKPPVSSLHLWGGGADPRPVCRDSMVAGDDPLTLALAAASGAAVAATAADVIQPTLGRGDLSALIVGRAASSFALRDKLRSIDSEWLVPLLSALRARRIDSLELVMPQARDLVGHKVTRLAYWKLWKGLRPGAGFPARPQGK
jgi:hypothetical protein